ncbi:hypothetical protein [Nonomuraea sp. SYSU D8015]|uniref:hypothetical protein n=1 Tax=Nonomuraea sp. SYSU D8015 TaxID=2593644 RepID=UPI0016617087|nr:hypothetical protein [Nonomuraea sp. SYSU D8015]
MPEQGDQRQHRGGHGAVTRLSGTALREGAEVPFSVVRKESRPVRTGRHAPYSGDPRHWAYDPVDGYAEFILSQASILM